MIRSNKSSIKKKCIIYFLPSETRYVGLHLVACFINISIGNCIVYGHMRVYRYKLQVTGWIVFYVMDWERIDISYITMVLVYVAIFCKSWIYINLFIYFTNINK